MSWVWVVAFTVLGSRPEHATFGAFNNKAECEQALLLKKQEMLRQGKEIVGTCYVTQKSTGYK